MFFEDNFEHFNLTGSAEPSTDDFNDRKVESARNVQRPFHRSQDKVSC